MAGILGLTRRKRHERAGFELYGVAVSAARDPTLYTALGVPDTLDGRFEMVGLHAFLLIQRLGAEPSPAPAPTSASALAPTSASALAPTSASASALAQAIFDAMFSDMDVNLREMGVGDLSVGKKVKAMWEAFHGRAAAYASALRAHDVAALEAALRRNVWRGAAVPEGAPGRLARVAFAQHANLAGQDVTALMAGKASFLPAAEAMR